ncbi:MAG: hypothetical protein L3J83_03730 [Proteobacteria bacterium]|nr:hypothetical protein [Pseudomonadota bacterium]
MINEQKLFEQIQKAEQAGDIAHAKKVAQFIKQQRTEYSQSRGFEDNTFVDKYGIEEIEKIYQDNLALADPTRNMSNFDKVAVGMGKGFTDIGQGVKQIGKNVGSFFGMNTEPEKYNKQIADEDAQFNKDFEGDWYAKGGRIGGQLIGTAPAGAIAGGAKLGGAGVKALQATGSRVGNARKLALQGAKIGATEAALLPTFGDNYLVDKAQQIGLGAGAGGLLGAGFGAAKGAKEIINDGVGATIANNLNKGSKSGVARLLKGDAKEIATRQELYERTGVLASKAERSGSNFDKILEEWSTANPLLSDTVESQTIKGLKSLQEWVSKQADNISKVTNPTEVTFRKIQKLPKIITNKLVKKRSETGQKLYGEIDKMAKGEKIISLDNVKIAMQNIIDSSDGVAGSDISKMANQAKKLSSGFDAGFTAKQGLRQLQAWSSHKTGKLFKDIEAFGADDYAKSQLKKALLADMDNVAGELGQKVRKANKVWEVDSANIKQVEASIFGKIAGKELKGMVDGVLENTISPETVLQKVRTSKPTEIKALMQYFNKYDDNLGKEFQAQYLNNAVEESLVNANTAGLEQVFNPVTFLNSIGVTKGKNGLEGVSRLKAIFGDSPKAKRLVNDMLALTRNKSDTFGKNFSGTASHNFLNNMFGSIGGFFSGSADLVKKSTSLLGNYVGSKRIVDNAYKPAKKLKKTINPFNDNLRNSAIAVAPLAQTVENDSRY